MSREGCIITEEQAFALLRAIDKNIEWVSSKGSKITDMRKFIENIIRWTAGVEEWAGVDE